MPAHRKQPSRKDAPTAGPARPVLRRAGALLDRWPFRRKLNVLVVVPVVVVAAMLALGAAVQISAARSAADTAQLIRDSVPVARLIDDIQTEHRQALLVSLRYEAAGAAAASPAAPDEQPDTDAYLAAQRKVRAQAGRVSEAFGSRLPAPEADALRELAALDTLRDSIGDGPVPADTLDPAYGSVVNDLIDGLGLGGPPRGTAVDSGPTLLDALLRADTAHASFETSVFAATTGDPNALIEFTDAVGDYGQYTYQAERFTKYTSAALADELAGFERGAEIGRIQQRYATLRIDPAGRAAESPEQVRAALDAALRDNATYEGQAQNRLHITQSLIKRIAADTQSGSTAAWWRAARLLTATVLAFAAWLLFSVLARRSVLRTVRRLTGAARQVSEATGRELARIADEDDAGETGPPRLAAVPIPVHDEIGELAEAFNRVQETATALLERQVLSRRNTAEMFGNVGRRVSNLTARQLALIDAVERGETDAAVLERLYRIDHIAVRLQRNADSLMLLAGISEPGAEASPARLSTTVRAALGRIEGYQRVAPSADGDVVLAPDLVGDLTLMLAELLENAVTFSPTSSRVDVRLRAVYGGVGGAVVEIVDHGLGMSPERLAEENGRLVRRERLDLVPTKVLGLFVVGVLSRRWGITVTLSRTAGGGVTAAVEIPAEHLLPGATAAEPPASPVRARAARSAQATQQAEGPAWHAGRTAHAEHAAHAGAPPRRPGHDPAGDGRPAAAPAARPPAGPGAGPGGRDREAPRPLRRRVRGATLAATSASSMLAPEPKRPRPQQTWRPVDAEAARSELDDFEAAVERAGRDSAPGREDAGGGGTAPGGFRGTGFRETGFRETGFPGTDFPGTGLRGPDFRGPDFRGSGPGGTGPGGGRQDGGGPGGGGRGGARPGGGRGVDAPPPLPQRPPRENRVPQTNQAPQTTNQQRNASTTRPFPPSSASSDSSSEGVNQ